MAKTQATRSPKRRALIVDDQLEQLVKLEMLLEDEYRVVRCQGGGAAFQLLSKDNQFDLIICDNLMPQDWSGVMLLQAIHRDRVLGKIPFILHTSDSPNDRAQGERFTVGEALDALGAGYIQKGSYRDADFLPLLRAALAALGDREG